MQPLRIATRKSDLAQWQAHWVADQLRAQGLTVELVLLTSDGDIDQRPITDDSGRGLFTRRIQDALLCGEANIAVHSLKDLPTAKTNGLFLAAVPPRETVRDCLVARRGESLDELPENSVIGTGSRRRAAQIYHNRPDLKCQAIRGNVDTRLRKMDEGQYDAILLAEAGLHRLGLESERRQPLNLELMLPAPGQGALGIEVREDDERAQRAVHQLDDHQARATVTAERALLAELEGGCLAPIAAHASIEKNVLRLRAVVLSVDGKQRLYAEQTGEENQAFELGISLAKVLLAKGAATLVCAAR